MKQAIAVLSLCLGAVAPVNAALLSASAHYSYGGLSYDYPGETGADSASGTLETATGALSRDVDGGNGRPRANGYASAAGDIGAAASSAYTTTEAGGSSRIVRTITNTGDTARDYSFTFSISGGFIGGDFNYWQHSDTATGSYNIVIALNDAPIWQSAAVLRLLGHAATLFKSGVDLGGELETESDYPGQLRANYRPGYYTDTLALGTLAAGESLTLSYAMRADIDIDAPSSCDYECFEFGASISDPNVVSSVALPATLPLMLIGLAGLRYARRGR